MAENRVTVPLDTSWFDEDPEKYLLRSDFIEFQEITGVDFYDLLSKDRDVLKRVQTKLTHQLVILCEINKLHFGFGCPFLIYTHNFSFFKKLKDHQPNADKLFLSLDMCDSLRRRHIALSHAILPQAVEEAFESSKTPVVVKNLGSGVGLDMINAARYSDGKIREVLNYDTNTTATGLGETIVKTLEQEGRLNPGVFHYLEENLGNSKEPADVIIMVGIICGLKDTFAKRLIKKCHGQLNTGGKLVVTSSNHHMRSSDPLANFLIQHIGTKDDPLKGWGLNFREVETMHKLLSDVGFMDIQIYDDANYPGKENISPDILYGVDNLPAKVMGYPTLDKPLGLPDKEILDRGYGYNWIAVATK